MGKRKHSRADSDDESKENRLEKKLRKLLREVKDYKKQRRKERSRSRESGDRDRGRRRSRSFDDSDIEELSQSPSNSPSGSRAVLLDRDQLPYLRMEDVAQDTDVAEVNDPSTSLLQEIANVKVPAPTDTATEMQQEKNSSAVELQKSDDRGQEDKTIAEDLDDEILEAIGSRVAEERVLAPAIPNSIAVRIEDILKKGLPKEEREKLLKAHAPPKNCVLTDPPKLNEEIKVSINETSKKRDDRIVEKQKKITACLALLGSSIVDMIGNNKEGDGNPKLSATQIELIKKLSEAARLLADLQRDETQTRRSLILAALSSSQKETLETGEADEWLFGQKLGDRLKAAKSIERSGKELKTKSKNTEKSKNSKNPSRRQSFKSRTSGGYQKGGYNRYQSQGKNWTNQKGGRKSFRTQTPTEQKKT